MTKKVSQLEQLGLDADKAKAEYEEALGDYRFALISLETAEARLKHRLQHLTDTHVAYGLKIQGITRAK